jgi:hypothetical protein
MHGLDEFPANTLNFCREYTDFLKLNSNLLDNPLQVVPHNSTINNVKYLKDFIYRKIIKDSHWNPQKIGIWVWAGFLKNPKFKLKTQDSGPNPYPKYQIFWVTINKIRLLIDLNTLRNIFKDII